jgi:lysozyme
MIISAELLALLVPLVKEFEGCTLKSYKKSDNVWTIGYGHTGKDVTEGMVCTQEQAEAWLLADIDSHYSQLCASVPQTPSFAVGKQAALLDFVYNLGIGRFAGSTLHSAVVVGAWQSAKTQLALWIHEAGKVEPGLVRRRDREIALIDT